MSYLVNISSEADKDLRAIYEYIAISLMSPQNAEAQLSRLEKMIYSLDNMPFRYTVYKNDIHFVPVDNYLVFYTVEENEKAVSIIRVMYGKQDIEKTL